MTQLSSIYPNTESRVNAHKVEADAHADSKISDPSLYSATCDVSGGAVTIDYSNGRMQFIDLGSDTTLTFTAVNNLTDIESIIVLRIKTSGSSITYTFPASTETIGDAPTAAGEHEVQFQRTSDSVLQAYLIPTPTT